MHILTHARARSLPHSPKRLTTHALAQASDAPKRKARIKETLTAEQKREKKRKKKERAQQKRVRNGKG